MDAPRQLNKLLEKGAGAFDNMRTANLNEHSPRETTADDKSQAELQIEETINDPSKVGYSEGVILSDDKFEDNEHLAEPLKNSLKELGYTRMTQIQAHAIPKLLEGRDVLGAAKTGSGKTLAFVVPALDLLWRVKATARQGTIVLILGPTRELVLQISEVVRDVGSKVQHTFGFVIGGSNRKEEARRLAVGVNLLVATPGRLLDHMENTKEFVYKHLAILILDEADRMLDIGFERELTKILSLVPKERQTALFSATQTTKVADLIRMSLRKPILVQIKDSQAAATVAGLKQYYITCTSAERLALLYKILKEKSKVEITDKAGGKRHLKIMVFFSSCQSCHYHEDLLRLFSGFLKISSLHGRKKQGKRLEVYNNFCLAADGILLCTNVAARGLDFPNVDYILQYDPPDDTRDYVHRVGRTARGQLGEGSALLFLLPEELKYLSYLSKDSNVSPNRLESQFTTLEKVQGQIEHIVEQTPELKNLAKSAYQKYLLAYQSHSLKDVFQVNRLDLVGVAKSFALTSLPKVDLPGMNALKKRPRIAR